MSKQLFSTDNEVRWCPGCGDYAILAAMQRYLASTDLQPENVVFVSGIGCAGRFPYYMNSYGFHVIHGRAPAVATGIKMMRPELSVWLVTGDGDGLSIGTNHLIHVLRRNVNINILLLNNQVYGLTKGQISPTSPKGQVTKTTPNGSADQPLDPIKLAISAGGSFVARGLDKDPKHLVEIFAEADQHPGTSFIEIYQNCPIFNDGAFKQYDSKATRDNHVVYLKDDTTLQFGKKGEENYLSSSGEWAITQDVTQALQHNISDKKQAYQLADINKSEFPLPLGVFYKEALACYSPKTKEVSAKLKDLNKLC